MAQIRPVRVFKGGECQPETTYVKEKDYLERKEGLIESRKELIIKNARIAELEAEIKQTAANVKRLMNTADNALSDWIQADTDSIRALQERNDSRLRIASLEGIIDNIDEIMHLLKPRWNGTPSMDGRYPCWVVWLPNEGTCERKTLKEAVIECAEQIKQTANE